MKILLFKLNCGLLFTLWLIHSAIILPIIALVAILRLFRWKLPHVILKKHIDWFDGWLHGMNVKILFTYLNKK
jgi:hypothetical protein